MTGKTTIEWTAQPGYVGAVWNPTTGCTRVSDGCDNCYAFALHDRRFASNLRAARAETTERQVEGPAKDIAEARARGTALPFSRQYDLPFSRVQLLPDRLDVPLRTGKPTCYFVDSMADLFHEDVPDEFIDRVFFTMLFATRHRFLVLTKRPERMRKYMEAHPTGPFQDPAYARERLRFIQGDDLGELIAGGMPYKWPAPNVWLGTSVEDQRAADERIPHLLATPAAVRFLSCEPLLGPVDLSFARTFVNGLTATESEEVRAIYSSARPYPPTLDWVIAGGESGPHARPMDLAWARSLRDQCATAGVAFFMKQLGSKPGEVVRDQGLSGPSHFQVFHLREAHGRNPDEWPADLPVREWPR